MDIVPRGGDGAEADWAREPGDGCGRDAGLRPGKLFHQSFGDTLCLGLSQLALAEDAECATHSIKAHSRPWSRRD